MSTNETPTRDGPETCPTGPCSECSGPHHYLPDCPEFAEQEPDHEAAKLGHESWIPCKHCPAWIEYEAFDAEFGEDSDVDDE